MKRLSILFIVSWTWFSLGLEHSINTSIILTNTDSRIPTLEAILVRPELLAALYPEALMNQSLEDNRTESSQYRTQFRALAETEYRRLKYLKDDSPPEAYADLDNLLNTRTSILVIRELESRKVHLMMSVVPQDADGLPLSEWLSGTDFPGLPEYQDDWDSPKLEYLSIVGDMEHQPLYSLFISAAPRVIAKGAGVEVKTLIRFEESFDLVGVGHHLLVAWEVPRLTMLAIPQKYENRRATLQEWNAYRKKVSTDIENALGPSSSEFFEYQFQVLRQSFFTHVPQPTMMGNRVWVLAMSDKLSNRYRDRYAIKRHYWSGTDPYYNDQPAHVRYAYLNEFERDTRNALALRRGGFRITSQTNILPPLVPRLIQRQGCLPILGNFVLNNTILGGAIDQ